MIIDTNLSDVKIIEPKRFGDDRGHFSETYSKRFLADAGLDLAFVQDNLSMSKTKGTVRGLHFQGPPSAQTKLVSCVVGAILDVAVDIRHGSPTFGRHVAVELSAENGRQLLVPRGFAHGFCTLVDNTLIMYKVDNYYDKSVDFAVAFDDPALAVAWPVGRDRAVLSDKDQKAGPLSALPRVFTFGEQC
jgi:dTDP-4-dehydrorhamnose 3,5-epimerase